DIKYLIALNNAEKAIGIRTLCCILELEQFYIENKIEPFLLKNELIQKTLKGRVLTNKGNIYLQHINLDQI
ncbi:MAG: Holliday junction DNA helicase RuvB C-terminal domain-containing protein, partial [Mycoplasma sp.]